METMSGSPYYIAPEVFMQKYNSKIDVWSMGVVMYIMLSGKVPFPGRNEAEIIKNVIKGEFHFKHPAFDQVSQECKDLIQKCLIKDNLARLSAQDALNHPWIVSRADNALNSGVIGGNGGLSSEIYSGMKEVNELAKKKNAALRYFTNKVTTNHFVELKEMFQKNDASGNGILTSEDFKRCISQTKMKVTDNDVMSLIQELDVGNTGNVDYNGFLKDSYHCNMFINIMYLQEQLQEADVKKKGMITVADLEHILT